MAAFQASSAEHPSAQRKGVESGDDLAGRQGTALRIVNADREPQNWLTTGRTYSETRYSPLSTIDSANVTRLGLSWTYELDTHRGQESTPLAVDGVLFTTSAWSKVQAFDAVSGKLLWQFDPKVPGAAAVNACCDVVNRGAAYWNGKVFVGTIDGRLIAIDAQSGHQVWSAVTVDQKRGYTITGAPRVVKGNVIIGNGGAEIGVRGYVSAYDAESGVMRWRFYTVPGEPGKTDGAASDDVLNRLAAKTWSGSWWSRDGGGGGGTVWDSMAYDPDLDLLYIGVGNSAYWNRKYRSANRGDNLFVASILALRPSTGKYVWHYQEVPGDMWDYTATQHMILADLEIGGKVRKVLMQAPKDGVFYILDRSDGKLLSGTPFVPLNWMKGFDPNGRPIMNPEADYSTTEKPWIGRPSGTGGHDWQPMAFNPQTGLVYIPVQINSTIFANDPSFKPLPIGVNLGIVTDSAKLTLTSEIMAAAREAPTSSLAAWDPKAQKTVWQIPTPAMMNGGVLTTAGGLVFQGDIDGFLSAYDAQNGSKLWSFNTGNAITAAPITYSVNGRQYVSVVVGWGGAFAMLGGKAAWGADGPRRNVSRVLTFRLDGNGQLPPAPDVVQVPAIQAVQFADADTVQVGRTAYHRTCMACHGFGAISGGGAPDLLRSPMVLSRDAWMRVVGDGVLANEGMVGFRANFSDKEIEAIRAYLIDAGLQRVGQ
jgi:quinohemoprotein ethanol dehydrogenase